MTALRAKPYEPPPPEPTLRSMTELFTRLERKDASWPEVAEGDRGTDISKVCFRGLSTSPDTEGGYLQASRQPMTAIEALGAQLIAGRMGAVVVPATAGDFSPIPRETTPPTVAWVSEGAAPPDQTVPAWGLISPTVKTGVVWSDVTRLLRVVSGGAADSILTRSFFRALARGVDRAAFHGAGTTEPLGIINVPDVGSVVGTTFSLATAASMLRSVEDGNTDTSRVSWCMSPDVAEVLRQREKAPTGFPRYVFEGGKILNRPAYVSNSINPGTIFAGDFSNLIVLSRAIELLVDRSTLSREGGDRILYFWHGDIIVTQPLSFCFAGGVS